MMLIRSRSESVLTEETTASILNYWQEIRLSDKVAITSHAWEIVRGCLALSSGSRPPRKEQGGAWRPAQQKERGLHNLGSRIGGCHEFR